MLLSPIEAIYPSLEVGDIIFYRTNSIVGRLIRKVTGHPHSHVAIYVGSGNVIEATAFTKSKIIRLSETKFEHLHIMRYKHNGLTRQQKMTMLENMCNVIGKHYDYKGVLLLALNVLTGLDKSKARIDLSRVWCSEIVDYLYQSVNISLVKHVNNYYVDIKDIEESEELQLIMDINYPPEEEVV